MKYQALFSLFFISLSFAVSALGIDSEKAYDRAVSESEAQTIINQLEASANPSQDLLASLLQKHYVRSEHRDQLVQHAREIILAHQSPLKAGQRVLLNGKYPGYIRYVFPHGKRASAELDGYGEVLYTYSRTHIAKEVENKDGFYVGKQVVHPGMFGGEHPATVKAVFENGLIQVSFDKWSGDYFYAAKDLR